MNTAEYIKDVVSTEADLVQLELQIARRADELARSRGHGSKANLDLECWLEAEREVFGQGAEPVMHH